MALFSHKPKSQEMQVTNEDPIEQTSYIEEIVELYEQSADTLNQSIQTEIDILNDETETNFSFQEIEDVKDEFKIPDYLLNDPEVVGYSSLDDQYNFYRLATTGIDLNNSVVIDLGCGRGDFGKYLREQSFSNLDYVGVDFNKNMIDASIAKYGETESFRFIHEYWEEWNNILEQTPKGDYAFNIFGLSLVYTPNFGLDKNAKLLSAIDSALAVSRVAIFLLLSQPIDGYLHYKPSEIAALLENKYLFGIDQTENLSYTRIIVLN